MQISFRTLNSNYLTNLYSFILGCLSSFSFAPYYFSPVLLITLFLLLRINKNHNFSLIFFFGFGFFLSGIYWITIALNIFGQMPFIGAITATFILCLFLAVFFLPLKFNNQNFISAFFIASLFTLLEWLRSFIFTGFPWLSLGYSQVPSGPLAGFLPIFGIHGVSFLIILSITLLAQCIKTSSKTRIILLSTILLIWCGGHLLKKINWTQPLDESFNVSLIQGNIDQSIKWNKDSIQLSLKKYLDLISKAKGDLIVLPETSIPLTYDQIPKNFLSTLNQKMIENDTKIILGTISKKESNFFNSAVFFNGIKTDFYNKYHLVPFGEFIPFRQIFKFIYDDWLKIPFNDLTRGSRKQKPFDFKNNRLAINICYEDVFGNEIIRSLPNATILINLSNDAWYGESNAADQHLQISQARSLETGRMMLRATNTGATAVINQKGKIVGQLPHFTEGILEERVRGYQGMTPYARYGNYLIVILSLIGIFVSLIRKTKL